VRRFGGRSFRSADAIVDSSLKPARRRAVVSVVSPAFSIRRDRRSASDLSIARRSRSSISSFKCPPALGVVIGRQGKRYRALRVVPACQSSAFLGQLRRTPVGVV
jgi:hypothetical protein